MSEILITRPLLKWVGGKTQIINNLLNKFPKEIDNYYEIFLGGGSVLFALLSYAKSGMIKINGSITAFDINEPLIYVYKNIKKNHEELYKEIQLIINDYNKCDNKEINRNSSNITEALQNKENFYYWMRKQYNNLTSLEKRGVKGSAMFIFLNKTCFRGMFRVGPNGFNVPYGNYKNPEIINKKHLEEIHNLIQNVNFKCKDFEISLEKIGGISNASNNFIYLDPPYAPETKTSFVGYTNDGFTLEKHLKLFKFLDNLEYKFIMSNSNVEIVKNAFKSEKYTIERILCKRSINSKKPDSKTMEVMIKNF